jgi:hypothetical protein
MNDISSAAMPFGIISSARQSFAAVSLLSGLGLAASLGLIAVGFDLGARWV